MSDLLYPKSSRSVWCRRVLMVGFVGWTGTVASRCSRETHSHRSADAGAPRDAHAPFADAASPQPLAFTPDAAAPPDDFARPPSQTSDLVVRGQHLVEALAQGNPELARDMLFPREAFTANHYAKVAAKAWERAIETPFRNQVIHEHKAGKIPNGARFVSLDIGPAARPLQPKKNGWLRPLWQVHHCTLTFSVDGKNRRLDINEMTAWRGAWYVTRLR